MRKIVSTASLLLAALVSSVVLAAPASATTTGTTQGCTPGYWKNHTSNWLETETLAIPTTRTLGEVFTATGTTGYAGTTFLDALSLNGGSGVDGAERILLRAAVASYLNSAHESVGYPLQRDGASGTIARVNAALASQDRDAILALASELDRLNNLGCPLS